MTAHARRGQRAQEEAVRENVPRGPAADQRRRHEQRRHLRRHGDQLRRRARRQAVQRVRVVDLARTGRLSRRTSTSRIASSGRCRAHSHVLLLPDEHGRLLSIRRSRRPHQPRPGDRHADRPRRQRHRHLPAQPVSPPTVLGRLPAARGELLGSVRAGAVRGVSDFRRPAVFRNGTLAPISAALHFGNDGVPRIRSACGQHDAARRDVAPAAGPLLSQQTFDADLRYYMRMAAPACSRCGSGASKARAIFRAICISAATPKCTATTT